jgi:hypothetical protein
MKTSGGFTLVEVMVSVLIGVVILEAIYTMVLLGQRAWVEYSDNLSPKQEIRRGLISMSSELREARNPEIVQDSHNVLVNFERPMVGAVSYSWNDHDENANKIIRTHDEQKRVLAKDVSAVSFVSHDKDEIMISLTGGKKQSFTLKEQIALRSKTGLFLQGQNEAVK